MAALPHELTDRIVDSLSDSPRALAACALASRTLLPRVRNNVFRTLSITCPGRRAWLTEVLRAEPALANHIRSLALTYWDERPFAELQHMTFPALHTFSLQMYKPPIRDLRTNETNKTDDFIVDVIAMLERTPNLQHLRLWDCAFCPAAFRKLLDTSITQGVDRLSVVDSYAFEGPGEVVVQPLRLDFRRIHINMLTDTTVYWLVRAPPSRLKSLSFTYSGGDDGQRVNEVLRALPELEHLRMEFGQQDASLLARRGPLLDLAHFTSLRTLYVHLSLPIQGRPAESFSMLAPRLLSRFMLPVPAPRIFLHVATYVHDRRSGPDPVVMQDVGSRMWAPLVQTYTDAYPATQKAGNAAMAVGCSGGTKLDTEVGILVDFYHREPRANPTTTAQIEEWAQGCPAKKVDVVVRWKARFPAYGLEERFMEICDGD